MICNNIKPRKERLMKRIITKINNTDNRGKLNSPKPGNKTDGKATESIKNRKNTKILKKARVKKINVNK